VKIAVIVVTVLIVYGAFSTLFHDASIVGEIGRDIGTANLEMFGYMAYIDFPLLMLLLYGLFKNGSGVRRVEIVVGWFLSILSIVIVQSLLFGGADAGTIGMMIYRSMVPLIGKAGLWLLWILSVSLSVVLLFERMQNPASFLSIFSDIGKFFGGESRTSDRDMSATSSTPPADITVSDGRGFSDTAKEFFADGLEWLYSIVRPSRKRELERIMRMPLDPVDDTTRGADIGVPRTRVRENGYEEYRHHMAEGIERDEMILHSRVSSGDIGREYADAVSSESPMESRVAMADSRESDISVLREEPEDIDIAYDDDSMSRPDDTAELYGDGIRSAGDDSVWEYEDAVEERIGRFPEKSDEEMETRGGVDVGSLIVDELEENSRLLADIERGEPEKPENFLLPSLDFLQVPSKSSKKINEAEIDRKIGELLDKLARFKVEGDVIRTYSGPLVTTFEFKPAPNVKISKILGLQDDLAMALQAETIRIQAPIPGRDVVGIEIPNREFETIYLREILESDLFRNSASPLTVALGKDIVGNPFITDLKKLPHLLIAGTTGSGKSVGINAMLLSLLYRNDPNSLKLILIDPKMLEFSIYNDIPHLLAPVITEPKKAISALSNVVAEMERRYRLLSENRVKNIDSFNDKIRREGGNPLPYIVIVIDELADLMMTGGKEVEYSIARLAQMARAAGIHLIVATQRPSVDVVTGLIKANLPSKLSYRVGQKIDSKVILDQMGADSLLGRGDALFTPPGSPGLVRLHAPWNTEEEIERVVEFLKDQEAPDYDPAFMGEDTAEEGDSTLVDGIELDPLYEQAKEIVLSDRKTSISYMQRKLQIGYNRSANIMDQLEQMGVLSPPNSKGAREILV